MDSLIVIVSRLPMEAMEEVDKSRALAGQDANATNPTSGHRCRCGSIEMLPMYLNDRYWFKIWSNFLSKPGHVWVLGVYV